MEYRKKVDWMDIEVFSASTISNVKLKRYWKN
jgi:hypothetical protein